MTLFEVGIWCVLQSMTMVLCLFFGYQLGRRGADKGADTRISFRERLMAASYEDEPGGVFEDHVPGGRYDQIEESEAAPDKETT